MAPTHPDEEGLPEHLNIQFAAASSEAGENQEKFESIWLREVSPDFGHLLILPSWKVSAPVQVWTGPRKALVAGQATLPGVRPIRAQRSVS